MNNQKTVLIFGAGSTAALGLPSTERQDKIFGTYFFEDEIRELEQFGFANQEIRRFDELKRLKIENEIDVSALIGFIRYFFDKDGFKMFDLYNLLDMQIEKDQNLTMYLPDKITLYPHQMVQYRKGVLVLLQEYFSFQVKKAQQSGKLDRYIVFFEKLAMNLLDKKGKQVNQFKDLRNSDFVISEFSYINFNWDVVLLWSMFIAHKKLNDQNSNYYSKDNQLFKLKIFNDFATFMASKNIKEGTEKWYPYNETVAFRLNDAERFSDRKVILVPTYFPHGQTNWLHCPYCGKLTAYLGDDFSSESDSLVMNPPLEGVSNYKCVHCGMNLSTKDSAMLLQTLFKIKTPYLEEIQRAMKIKVTEASRLIFIGYSFPNDDLEYRSFFRTAKTNVNKTVNVVLLEEGFDNSWYNADAVFKMSKINSNREIVSRYCSIFGKESVFVNFCGFPNAMESILKLF